MYVFGWLVERWLVEWLVGVLGFRGVVKHVCFLLELGLVLQFLAY